MSRLLSLMVLSALTVVLLCLPALSAGTGIRVFTPPESSVAVDQLPLHYNGSFIVQNDGLLEGVYVVRVAVDDPAAITWLNVTPSGFVLAPGELRQVNFSINIGEGEAFYGTYHIVFMPSLLPKNVEPYLDTFADYASEVAYFNFTVDITGMSELPFEVAESPGTPVTFSNDSSRVNLVQVVNPENGSRVVTQIDRAIRINMPPTAEIGRPVNLSVSVFQGLSSRDISLMAISPDGIFYPVEGENFTFDRLGRWGMIALVGDVVLLGKPVEVSQGGVKLVMPGLGTIFAAIALLLLLSIVPIWLTGRSAGRADPYEEVTYKAYVIKKYVDKFDPLRLRRSVSQLKEEYDDLVARHVKGDRETARISLEELETLASFESPSNV
jgi:hypothetical protein